MLKSIELRGKLGEKVAEFRSLKDSVTPENASEIETRSASLKTEMASLEADIADYEKIEAMEVQAEVRSKELRAKAAGSRVSTVDTDENDAELEEFRSYLRTGVETRALSAAGSPGNLPTSVAPKIVEQLQATGAIFTYLTTDVTPTGQPINVNFRTSPSGTGSYISEIGQRGAAADISLAVKTLGALTITSNVVGISNTLLRDAGDNIEDVVTRDTVKVCANKMELEMLLGDGQNGHAEGLFVFANVATTTASNTAVAYSELVNTQTAVDSAYDATSIWVMHKKTLGAIRNITDSQNRPLLLEPLTAGAPYTLLGAPVVLSNKLPVFAANTVCIGYGDVGAAAYSRIVGGSAVLKRYTDSAFGSVNQTGFQADIDFDQKFVNSSAFYTIKVKA